MKSAADGCTVCPSGKFTATASAATQCTAHTPCAAGKYTSAAGVASADPVCTACPSDKTSTASTDTTKVTTATAACTFNSGGGDGGTAVPVPASNCTKNLWSASVCDDPRRDATCTSDVWKANCCISALTKCTTTTGTTSGTLMTTARSPSVSLSSAPSTFIWFRFFFFPSGRGPALLLGPNLDLSVALD